MLFQEVKPMDSQKLGFEEGTTIKYAVEKRPKDDAE
jgi:hypothetical protein